MPDTIDRAEAAKQSHLQYLFGLGVGLGLSTNLDEWSRLRKDLTEAQQKDFDRGYLIGIQRQHPSRNRK